MNPSELYKLWAPEGSIWSNWVKPVLFADRMFVSNEPPRTSQWSSQALPWAPAPDGTTAMVLDLPGAEAVWLGIALSQRGFRPVPLYNGVRGPMSVTPPLVSVSVIVSALQASREALANLQLTAAAPPVFLLDSDRFAGGTFRTPGRFDNRWWVFPQDFPSANFLMSHGVRSVLLGQSKAGPPQRDLAHVLLRWQESGIQILSCGVSDPAPPAPIQIERPDRFRSLWYQALVIAGLRRNSAGGFGAVIPEPGSSG